MEWLGWRRAAGIGPLPSSFSSVLDSAVMTANCFSVGMNSWHLNRFILCLLQVPPYQCVPWWRRNLTGGRGSWLPTEWGSWVALWGCVEEAGSLGGRSANQSWRGERVLMLHYTNVLHSFRAGLWSRATEVHWRYPMHNHLGGYP